MLTIVSRLRSVWDGLRGRRGLDVEMEEEFGAHVQLRAADLVRAGVTPGDAMRRAKLEFGSFERYREEGRASRGLRLMDEIRSDLRFAFRSMRKSPSFTAAVVLTLALGIGANTAIFSVLDAVLLRPLPVPAGERLVVVWGTDRTSGTVREPSSYPDFADYRARTRAFAQLAAFTGAQVTWLPARGDAERVSSLAVTHEFLPMLGLPLVAGGGFTAEEDGPGAERVAIVGEAFWRSRLGGDAGVIGSTISLNGVEHVVIGVAPDDAAFGVDQVNAAADYSGAFRSGGRVDVWLPLRASAETSSRDRHPYLLIGRLADGATLDFAASELAQVAGELEAAYASNAGRGVHLEPLEEVALGPVRPALLVLFGAVVLVLLVACVNVANLLLARGTTRAREVAVRSALGAARERIARQFAVEALLLTLLAAAAGVVLAWVGLRGLVSLAPPEVPRLQEIGLDLRVLTFTAAISIAVALVFGLVPTAQASRRDLQGTLRRESRGSASRSRRRVRSGLVIAELALAVVLVIAAGLTLRSLRELLSVDPGFRTAGVLKAQYELPAARYPRDFANYPAWPEVQAFQRELIRRARELPGVQAAAIAGAHPLDVGFTNSFVIVGRESEAADQPEIRTRQVSAEYFAALGVPLRAGRAFTASDDAAAPPVAVINEAAAERFFTGQDPLGQRVGFWGVARTVVGVVGNERFAGLAEAAPPAIYTPLSQTPAFTGTLLVRTAGDAAALVGPVRGAARALDPSLALYGIETMDQTLSASLAERRFVSVLLSIFGAVALLLALIGVHGVLSFAVRQRVPELGIRMALGASSSRVLRLVLREGVLLAGAGVLLGAAGALAGTRLLAGMLYGVSSTDPATFVGVAAAILAVAAVASWSPARRAARVDPGITLRAE